MHIITEGTRRIPIYPKELGSTHKIIKDRLRKDIVGTNLGTMGMIVDIIEIKDIGFGYVESGGGGITKYNVTYVAKVFSPKENEIIYGSVTKVTPQGLLLVTDHNVEFYVADREIPAPYVYNNEKWKVSCDSSLQIQVGSYVQVRVMGVRIDSSSIFGIATMKGDYLGLLKK